MINSFTGNYRFLSNFWPSTVSIEGYSYPTVEHAYQAMKTLDINQRQRIRDAANPGIAKKMGREIKLRPDWELLKLLYMTTLIENKFFPDSQLASMLLATGDDELVEGNNWGDTYWGVCRGKGENHLGKINGMA